jgi:colanic acid biosynthesis glycosyl transferase WcaI
LCLSTPVFGSWLAWLLAYLKDARFIYAIFDLHPEGAANAGLVQRGVLYRLARAADTLLCRSSHSIVTLTDGLRRAIVARGIDRDRVVVVPFWIDAHKIRPTSRDNAWRRAHAIEPETFVALYAGTIGYISGAEMLAETARHLLVRQDILIACVGDGPVKDRLVKAASGQGLTNLRFWPFQHADVLNDVLATADVGLVTLRPECGNTSVPSKVLGYLAAGRPVIAAVPLDSDTADLIREGNCGRSIPPSDPAALANAIRECADAPEIQANFGRRGRAYLEKGFARDICVSAYERLLAGQAAEASPRCQAVSAGENIEART